MEQLPVIGTGIENVIQPTVRVYLPLLQANASEIYSTLKTRETHQYGPHPRQNLDVYLPKDASSNSPILVWAYGGGLIAGDKNLPIPGDLVYSNAGHFFASRGFVTLVMNYRLVNTHDAKFPSGGEDVALVIEWIVKHFEGQRRDLFGLGNSAGGIHWSTFIFHKDFEKTLEKVTTGDGIRLKGVTFLSVPFEFSKSATARGEVLKAYFGENVAERSPYGLLSAADDSRWALLERGNVQFNVTTVTLDPEEILSPNGQFVKTWKEKRSGSGTPALTIKSVEGHNHISPFFALGTGIDKEEAWGNELVKWMVGVSRG